MANVYSVNLLSICLPFLTFVVLIKHLIMPQGMDHQSLVVESS
jgi:hypothetical protein